jgi:hypothetical protein
MSAAMAEPVNAATAVIAIASFFMQPILLCTVAMTEPFHPFAMIANAGRPIHR